MMLGEKIRYLRELEGMSQIELGKKLGVTSGTMSKYESGALEPSWDMIKKIRDIFSVTADYFFDDNYEQPPVSPPNLTEDEIELINKYRDYPNGEVYLVSEKERRLIGLFRQLNGESDKNNAANVNDLIEALDDRETKKAPLSDEKGNLIVQRALKDTGLLDEQGKLSEEGGKVISDFIASNADILKKLMDKGH